MRPSTRPVSSNPALVHAGEDVPSIEFGKTLQEYTTGDIKLSMWIPSDFVGRIIGKKGTVVAGLQRETKVESITALPPVGNSLWTAVVIIGDILPIFAACGEVTKLVDNEVDGVVVEFMINYKKPFFLYGSRKDTTIKRISGESNTRIYFPEFDPKKQSFKDLEPFTLEGTKEDCHRAVELLEREATNYQQYQTTRLARQSAEAGGVPVTAAAPPAHQNERVPRHRLDEGAAVAAQPVAAPVAAAPHAAQTAPPQTVFNATQRLAGRGPGDARANRPTRIEGPPPGVPAPVNRVPRPVPSAPEGGGSNIIDKLIQAKRESAKSNALPVSRGEPRAPYVPHGPPAEEEPAGPKLTPEELAAKYPTVYQIIDVPTNLVGLLLSRRPQSRVTTINIIQTMTHTIISKQAPVGDKVVAALQARGDTDKPASATSEGNDETGSQLSDGSDESEEITDPRYASLSTKERKARMIADSEMLGYVTFRVTAYNQENVDAVVDALNKIIKGDRISEVIENMRTPARNLPWPPAATREAARERRAEKKAKRINERGPDYAEREFRPRPEGRFGGAGRGGRGAGRGYYNGGRGGRGGRGRIEYGNGEDSNQFGQASSVSANIEHAAGRGGASRGGNSGRGAF